MVPILNKHMVRGYEPHTQHMVRGYGPHTQHMVRGYEPQTQHACPWVIQISFCLNRNENVKSEVKKLLRILAVRIINPHLHGRGTI